MKTLQECKDEVARSYQYENWAELFLKRTKADVQGFSDEATNLFAQLACEALREKIANEAKMIYHCGHTKNNYPTTHHQAGADNLQIDRASILSTTIELL